MEDATLAVKKVTTPDVGAADVAVIEVLVKPGDRIEVDTPVVTLESDKATMEIPATEAGVVKEVKVKVGDQVATGAVLLTLEGEGDTKAEEAPAAKAPPKKAGKDASAKKMKEAEKPVYIEPEIIAEDEEDDHVLSGTLESDTNESDGEVHAGPGVRRLARELGVNLAQLAGSGPKQRILKEDIQKFVKTRLSQPAQQPGTALGFVAPQIDFTKFGVVETQALSRIKKISGKHLQRNWMMIPHVTQFGSADITTLEEFRVSQKEQLEKQKIKLTPLVFVMKAIVASLRAFPTFNASLDPDGENIILKKYFNIGVAVDTPDGLVVPVIRDVDKKGLVELAKELAVISEKARNKQLTPGDMQGGCFSISSLGGIGGTAFTPIINAPEVAILGVSKTSYQPVYQDGAFVPRLMLPLSLSYDHRVIDGAEGARFIVHLSNMLSDIRNLLL